MLFSACLETLEIPLDREWEIDRESLILGETLGEGAFGVVVKAEALCLIPKSGSVSTVAVKMLKGTCSKWFCLIHCRKGRATQYFRDQLSASLSVASLIGYNIDTHFMSLK